MESEDMAEEAGTVLQKKSTRTKMEDGLLVKKARRSTKSTAISVDAVGVESTMLQIKSSSAEEISEHIASGREALPVKDMEIKNFQPPPANESSYPLRLLSDSDRVNLDHKYGCRGTPVALEVLVGKTADPRMIALENLFFHTARKISFQLRESKFFVNLSQDLSESSGGRIPIILSCDKGIIRVFLESLDDLSAFAPELSKFSIGSYPAPVQGMLLNSLLSPLLDRLSALLSTKVSMRLEEMSQNSLEPKFSVLVRLHNGDPHEGKEVALLLSAKITVSLPMAEEIGKFIQRVPAVIFRTFPMPFRCENRVAETTISREDLFSLQLGDVILLDNTSAIEAKQTRLLGLSPYEFACVGNGDKLTIAGISGASA
jgi:hypothetical protein